MPWTLCTQDDVRALHGINTDVLKDEWSEFAEALIIDHLGNRSLLDTVTYTDELYSGDKTTILLIQHPRITSITSIYVNDVLVSPDTYSFNTHGILLNTGIFAEGSHNIKVTYESGGTGNSSDTVRFACASMISALFNHYGRRGADGSTKWATTNSEFGEPTANINLGLITNLKEIMKQTLKRENVRVR